MFGGEAAGRAKRGLKFWLAGKLIFWEGGGINFEFWWGVLIVKECLIFDYAPTMSLRGPALQTLRRARSASLVDGMDGMGWDGMGYQKCPSIFFILCVYIYPISNLLYM